MKTIFEKLEKVKLDDEQFEELSKTLNSIANGIAWTNFWLFLLFMQGCMK